MNKDCQGMGGRGGRGAQTAGIRDNGRGRQAKNEGDSREGPGMADDCRDHTQTKSDIL